MASVSPNVISRSVKTCEKKGKRTNGAGFLLKQKKEEANYAQVLKMYDRSPFSSLRREDGTCRGQRLESRSRTKSPRIIRDRTEGKKRPFIFRSAKRAKREENAITRRFWNYVPPDEIRQRSMSESQTGIRNGTKKS